MSTQVENYHPPWSNPKRSPNTQSSHYSTNLYVFNLKFHHRLSKFRHSWCNPNPRPIQSYEIFNNPKIRKILRIFSTFQFWKEKIYFFFREDEAVINRYGFNSDGHEVDNLRKLSSIIFVKTCLDLATFFKRHISVEHGNLGRIDNIHVYLKDSYFSGKQLSYFL